MFLRRAGIHLILLPVTPSPSLAAAGITQASFLSSSIATTFHLENYSNPPPVSSRRYSTLKQVGTSTKCKSYNRDHLHFIVQSQHERLYHQQLHQEDHHLKSSVFSEHHLQSNNRQLRSGSSCNNWQLGRSSCNNHSNYLRCSRPFSTKSSNVGITDGGGEDGDGGKGGGGGGSLVVTIKDGLSSRESADDFLNQLSDHQKQLIYHTLNIEVLRNKYEGTLGSSEQESHHYLSRFGRPATQKEDPTGTLCEVPSKWLHQRLDEKAPPAPASAIWGVTLKNALPFIGFGFLDNLIMILAGDYIDITIGTALGISTMAAAALGNAISDVAGIGSAWYVEELAGKIGIRYPELTPTQMASGPVRWASNFGRAFGVLLGCILGMFPLLFLPSAEDAKERKDKKVEEAKAKKKQRDEEKVEKSKFT